MYSEFYAALGAKIRERRKNLKMTQAELCGNYMTRNMLSRIETGMAHPSLDTLLFIAERLKTPVEYFTATDKKSEAQYRRIESVLEIRRLFATGQYHRCIELAGGIESDDDEINFIMAECCYMLARDNMKSSKLTSASINLERCIDIAGKCSYNSDILISTAAFLLVVISKLRQGKLPDARDFNDDTASLIGREYLLYLYSLSKGATDDHIIEAISSSIYKNHLKAKQMMNNGQFREAAALLSKIADARPGCVTLYFTLVDLETCSQKTDNYKSAYEYTKRRLDLLETFNL